MATINIGPLLPDLHEERAKQEIGRLRTAQNSDRVEVALKPDKVLINSIHANVSARTHTHTAFLAPCRHVTSRNTTRFSCRSHNRACVRVLVPVCASLLQATLHQFELERVTGAYTDTKWLGPSFLVLVVKVCSSAGLHFSPCLLNLFFISSLIRPVLVLYPRFRFPFLLLLLSRLLLFFFSFLTSNLGLALGLTLVSALLPSSCSPPCSTFAPAVLTASRYRPR